MNKKRLITAYWFEHYVNEEIGMCALCGNTGVIDTRETAISPVGVRVGGLHWCLCPTGQAMRRQNGGPPREPRR